MANWLQMLVGGLAGGAGAGADYYGKKRLADEEKAERDAAIARQQAQWQQTFDAGQANNQRIFTKSVVDDLPSTFDLGSNPELLDAARKANLPLNSRTVATPGAPVGPVSMPNAPSFKLPEIGGLPAQPGLPGIEGAGAPPTGLVPSDDAPGQMPGQSFGLGTVKDVVNRPKTMQEEQQELQFKTRAKAMRELLPQVAPQYQSLLQNSIEALERGVEPEVTSAQVMRVIQESQPKPPAASAQPDFEFQTAFQIATGKKFDDSATPQELAAANKVLAQQRIAGTRPPASSGGGVDLSSPTTPVDPDSQDLMGHTGLSAAGFFAVTGQMAQLSRDQATRNAALAEMQRWAADKGIDISSFRSRYKAVNEALQTNIERQNNILTAQDELIGDIESLGMAAAKAGLDDVTAANKAKLWLQGQLNDPGFADYAFALEAMVSDLARYNAASSGRPADQSDMTSARAVLQRGIAKGGLTGIKDSLARSVTNVGAATDKAVERTRKQLWDLFGVGDKYRAQAAAGSSGDAANKPIELEIGPDGKLRPKGGG